MLATRVDDWAGGELRRLRGVPGVDLVMYGASRLGDDGRFWIAAAAVRAVGRPAPLVRLGRQLAWLGIESAVVNGPAKGLVRRPRPVALGHPHPRRLRVPSNSSFPSGHAASAATMAVLLSEDGLAPLWWAVALTIAASRVYVGVHHASDVAAGLAIGAGIGYLARHVDLPLLVLPDDVVDVDPPA
ncbi:MAG: phosphatase PAP2 family protein [Acidimicrobiales bacterium]|nr:phosphatase PAP2 family protein [Actinomycetota bacterium]